MSAYLSRLIQRFSPPASDDGSVALQPFIRSRSPIAAIDQRLGVDESLGQGLADARGGLDEPMAASPEPMRVQRKAASATATAPTLAAPPPVTKAPAANLSPPQPSPVQPANEGPRPAELGPRREPMDPGPLFAPFALHHADDRASDDHTLTPSKVELRTIETIIDRREAAATSNNRAPALVPTPSSPAAPTPAWTEPAFTPSTPTRSDAPLPVAPRLRVVNPPWIAFDRNSPALPELPHRLDAPELEPQPVAPTRVESRVIPLLIEPRRPAPAPFVPEPEPMQTLAPTRPVSESTTRTRTEIASKPTPSPRPSSAPTPQRGKLDIESISQIGPLARHFPNRRRFRLRFR